MNNTIRKNTGKIGELIAQQYLESCGYRLLEKNFSCRSGEIDIIANKNNIMIFLEVKTRTSDLYGKPIESIGINKVNRIRKISNIYMARSEIFQHFDIRFDVISIFIKRGIVESLYQWIKTSTINLNDLKDLKDTGKLKLEHIENAF